MAPQLTHTEIQELLGAYALDAVEPDEALVVEAHLLGCPRCRAEVAEHREAASLLSFAGEAAPEGVWSRISADLEEGPPPLAIAPVVPMRRRAIRSVVAVAAAAAVAIGVLGVQVVRQSERIDRLAAVSDRRGIDQAAAAAAVAPDARSVRLASPDGAYVVDGVVLPDGHGYLIRATLPRLSADETYQLWGVIGSHTISLGVLGEDLALTPFRAAGPLSGLAITAEASGGAEAPTREPIVQGSVGPT